MRAWGCTAALALGTLIACQRSGASARQSVVLYTVSGPELTDPVLRTFHAAHPELEARVVAIPGTGEMIARLEAEKENPGCDVAWGGSSELYAANGHLFHPVELPNDAKTRARDPAHLWHATDLLFQVIAVNTEKLPNSAQHPSSFAALVAPDWAGGEIAFANPRSSGTSYSLLTAMISLHGWPYVMQFIKRARLLDDSAAMFSQVRDGELGVGFINEDLGSQWVKAGIALKLVYPSDGVPNQVGVAAVIKGARHLEAAATLVDFLMSAPAQQVLVTAVGRRSSRPDIQTPAALEPIERLKLVQPDPFWVLGKSEILGRFAQAAGLK